MTVGFAAGMIKKAEVDDTKIMFFDKEVKFEKPLVSVLEEGKTEETLYVPFPLSSTDVNEQAIEIITKTGIWSYVESYLPKISEETLKQVVDIYNSKHMNQLEHKDAKLILESLKK